MFLEMIFSLRTLTIEMTHTLPDLARKIDELKKLREKPKQTKIYQREVQKLKLSFQDFIWLHWNIKA